MSKTRTRQITTPSDRELTMTRTFDAPREVIFDAWTKPDILKQWLGVRRGWTFAVCDVDLKPGGRFRFVWRGPDRHDLGMGGEYLEVVRPERIVNTEAFDQTWYPGSARVTTVFTEQEGRTTVVSTVRYDSKDARDTVLGGPMKEGVAESYDALDAFLAKQG